MTKNERAQAQFAPSGYLLAPIHPCREGGPLGIAVLVSVDENAAGGAFVLLLEVPGSRVYLGAVFDMEARILEWVEVWVQTLELRDLAFSSEQEQLTNQAFDQRWIANYEMHKSNLPEHVFVTGMERKNPNPILIKRNASPLTPGFASMELTNWQLCKDDALLESHGLPGYSASPFRYLHDPALAGPKIFLATAPDAPANSHVQGIERINILPDVRAVFNPHAGLIRVARFNPLALDDFLRILEGGVWSGLLPGRAEILPRGIYSELRTWSASPKGISFLLHAAGAANDRVVEIFYLKLALLRDMFKEVRSYVKAHQLPLLNLSPSSFNISLQNTGDQFPALWTAKCILTRPGQAHPLKIKFTAQRYFVRLGKIEPSPFLPEGLGAHSFGIGSVRIRNVLSEADGTVIEGTLVAEEYLTVNSHDLLWFKLPLAEERLAFYAHVYASERVGPKEVRFRTVPTHLSESVVSSLKRASGSVFQKSPYEVWPLLSSPCDLYSLGIIAIRILLANSKSNLPVVIDEVLSLAWRLGKESTDEDKLLPEMKSLLEREPGLLDLVSPHSLLERDCSPALARTQLDLELWLETICLLVRMFPGAGKHSYCSSFGDVSPLALETVFNRSLQELEILVQRLRSLLTPSLSANEEIASLLLKQLEPITP